MDASSKNQGGFQMPEAVKRLLMSFFILCVLGGIACFMYAFCWNGSENLGSPAMIAAIACFAASFIFSMLVIEKLLYKLLVILAIAIFAGCYINYGPRYEEMKEREERSKYESIYGDYDDYDDYDDEW